MSLVLERLWLLGLGVAFLPVLIWLFRRRRSHSQVQTPFLELWETALAQSPWWERWLSYLPSGKWALAILFFLSALFAVSGPRWKQPGGGQYHLVLDCSASMGGQGTEKRPGLDQSIEEILRIWRVRETRDRFSLYRFDSQLQLLLPLGSSSKEAEAALDLVHVAHKESDFSKLKPLQDSRSGNMLFFTDRVGEQNDLLDSMGPVFTVKRNPNQIGIVGLRVEDDWPKKTVQIEIEVLNNSAQSQTRQLQIEIQGRMAQSLEMVIPASQSLLHSVRLERGEGGLLQLRLLPEDDYTLDDRAGAILFAAPKSPIAVLGEKQNGNPYLQAVIELLAGEQGASARFLEQVPQGDSDTVIVVNGGRLESFAQASGKYLLFGPEFTSVLHGPVRESPRLVDWDREDPVLQGISLDWLDCVRALSVQAPVRRLAWAQDGALIFSQQENARRVVATAFRLEESNFVRQPSFPLFVRRAYAWLCGQDLRVPAWVQANQEVFISPEYTAWRAPDTVGEVMTPLGRSYVNFFSKSESANAVSSQTGWNREIPEGPGVWLDLSTPCFQLAGIFLLLFGLISLIERAFIKTN